VWVGMAVSVSVNEVLVVGVAMFGGWECGCGCERQCEHVSGCGSCHCVRQTQVVCCCAKNSRILI